MTKEKTWFIRFTIKTETNSETMSALLKGEDASITLNSFIEDQIKRHGITRHGVDVISMNLV